MAGQVKAEQRVWRTTDGQLVRENDPRGAFLAYGVGDPVADKETDAYRELVDGERSPYEVPGLMHDRLATEIADAARVIGADPVGPAAEVAHDTLVNAAAVVDAEHIAPPAPTSLPPAEVVRQVAQDEGDDRPVADAVLYRTDEGGLVREGDPAAVTVAYGKGDRVEKADQDAYGKLGDAPADDAATAPARKTAKAAAKPADKAAATPDNK